MYILQCRMYNVCGRYSVYMRPLNSSTVVKFSIFHFYFIGDVEKEKEKERGDGVIVIAVEILL